MYVYVYVCLFFYFRIFFCKAASNVGPYGLFCQPALVCHSLILYMSLFINWANKDACLLACSTAILIHAFVTSRVDYCNLLLAGAPKSVTNKLQRVMNAAARFVSGMKKYDRGLTHLFHSELHWLDVAD